MFQWYRDLSFEDWVSFINNNNNKNPLMLRRLAKMSLVDYTDFKDEIEGAEEPTTLRTGEEAKVRIIMVRSGVSDKNECDWYSPVFDVPAQPMVKEFNDFFWELDREKLTKKEFERALWKFKKFAACFDLDYTKPFSWEDDLVGLEGWIIAGTKKSEDYGEQNTIKKYISPK